MEPTPGVTEWDKPPERGVKAKIQQWESGETSSLHRKDLKNRTFRQSLYSDSSLRRPAPVTRDPRLRHPYLPSYVSRKTEYADKGAESTYKGAESTGSTNKRAESSGKGVESTYQVADPLGKGAEFTDRGAEFHSQGRADLQGDTAADSWSQRFQLPRYNAACEGLRARSGSEDFKRRRLRMASTGSVLEASDVLAAALEQMDGIIASSKYDMQSMAGSWGESGNHAPDWWQSAPNLRQTQSQTALNVTATRVSRLLGDVRSSLEVAEDKEEVKNMLPREVLDFLKDWIMSEDYFLSASGYLPESVEDKVRKLEADKQSLTLQVSVLSEQVEAQSEKIADLEIQIDDKDNRLMQAQDMLQSELLTHTSLETHKLDLMAEISSLKLRLASTEKDRRELDERCRGAQRQIAELEAKVLIKDAEMAELRQRLIRNGTVMMPETGGDSPADRALEREKTLDRLKKKQTEVEKLKKAVDTLMLANEDKDRRLEDMRRLLKRYRRVEEILVQAQGRKAVEELLQNVEDDTSSTSSSSIHDTSLRDHSSNEDYNNRHGLSSPSATSTPVHHAPDSLRMNGNHGAAAQNLPVSARQALGMARSNSCENIAVTPDKGAPDGRKKGGNGHNNSDSYGTLPKNPTGSYSSTPSRSREGASIERDIAANNLSSSSSSARRSRGFPMLGKTLLRIRSGKRSSSAPNLAHTEVVTDDEDGLQHMGMTGGGHHDPKKRRGLRRLFGKLKRSSSQDFEGGRDRVADGGEFRRGGVRATATARLAGWSQRVKLTDTDMPFSRWDGDRVTAWMNEIGLNMYLGECKRWVRNGEQLLRASGHDLEKELGIKNVLHRKKLQLALQGMGGEKDLQICDLDHNFVARWLDDIGLPQYKDLFVEARVDGRMLHYLTVDDLLNLKVTNELHHISIKRGIQILRLNGFNPGCLRRRPFPEELNQPILNQPGEVMLWTNHRVMEWLRTIDLSEYAPNLRGSGVHGALMVLEPRFNAELFAQLLSIPATKTLLRRHLSTHFVGIIGPETQTRKREYESSPGYLPLVVNAKIKKGKFGLFGHKRTKSDCEIDSFICPMDGMKNGSQGDAKAAQEIGAVSKEINSLTTMLSHERFMDSAKTSNV